MQTLPSVILWSGDIPKMSQTTNYKIYGLGLVYWGLTPQQQPGSYQGGEMMMMKSVISGQQIKNS